MHAVLCCAALCCAGPSCRKAKQWMLTDGVQGLQKLKKKGKGVTKAIIEEREKQVGALRQSMRTSQHQHHISSSFSCHLPLCLRLGRTGCRLGKFNNNRAGGSSRAQVRHA
jgi:hypothetical protein